MIQLYKVQGWRNHKYTDLWTGSNKDTALIMACKSYYTRSYSPIRVIELRTEQIELYKWERK